MAAVGAVAVGRGCAAAGAGTGRARRRPRRAGATAQSRSRVGRHAQRDRAARIGVARAGGHRASRLRIGVVRHVHPHRLEHHLEASAHDRRQAGERRSEPGERGRDFLSRPSGDPAGRAAEGRSAVVRQRRGQGVCRRRTRRSTAFESWPEFGEMLGARYDGHPWNTAYRHR